MSNNDIQIESHPWEPFIPDRARILIMGTFPPQPKRWAMDFYYPNRTNDFWFMMGLIFKDDKYALYDVAKKCFDLSQIKQLLVDNGIALSDTGRKVRRLMGNASDKFLEIVEPVPLYDLLSRMPACHTVATTGEKAASVVAELTDTQLPKMGEMVDGPDDLKIWRMPSTSRAYPMKLEKKAEYYAEMFRQAGILI
ncbi:MAG: uracil-DNA glycosylase family protein [Muribaculaceae bacterium]|nr:uracil-DNA glycosylase family protein [Muribaculaceae bacterium]